MSCLVKRTLPMRKPPTAAFVGIFFVVGDSILVDKTPVEQGEPYADAVQYGGHYAFWETLDPATPAERKFKERDYDAYPRGRVVYMKKKKTFVLYADKCIRPTVLKTIARKFGLSVPSRPFSLTGPAGTAALPGAAPARRAAARLQHSPWRADGPGRRRRRHVSRGGAQRLVCLSPGPSRPLTLIPISSLSPISYLLSPLSRPPNSKFFPP